ncbi:hypothetical protein I4U23_016353 [Adineta vaga]|nr:hypothetical protein I4U23_016353 [Adineta vaga]
MNFYWKYLLVPVVAVVAVVVLVPVVAVVAVVVLVSVVAVAVVVVLVSVVAVVAVVVLVVDDIVVNGSGGKFGKKKDPMVVLSKRKSFDE